jgi:putative transposase
MRIVQMKLSRQHWGPKKVIDRLRTLEPGRCWPADSTAGEILKRAGLVKPKRRRRRHVAADPRALVERKAPGESWSADFKGDLQLTLGPRCYPLTITDNHSRYLLQCWALRRTATEAVNPWFEWVFREHGIPETIRTDNGTPFASLALGGIGWLSTWWIRLGIRPERTRPAKPSENGRHERMHRSLKEAVISPPAATLAQQQRRFDDFVHEYNRGRSHESLKRKTPASVHRPTSRAYPLKLADSEYDTTDATVRKVRHNG